MSKYAYSFIFAVLLLNGCTKSNQDPNQAIRVTYFKTTYGSTNVSYNEAGLVSKLESADEWYSDPDQHPLGTPFKTVSNFEYEGNRVVRSKSKVDFLYPVPVTQQTTENFSWDANGYLKASTRDNAPNNIQWFTDSKGRLTGHSDGTSSPKWSYDDNGNIVLPSETPDIKISITYTRYKNPFNNGNTGVLYYVSNRLFPYDVIRFLSAYLPEKIVLVNSSPTTGTDVTERFTYGFNDEGLLNMVIIDTKLVEKRFGTPVNEHRYSLPYPVNCIRVD